MEGVLPSMLWQPNSSWSKKTLRRHAWPHSEEVAGVSEVGCVGHSGANSAGKGAGLRLEHRLAYGVKGGLKFRSKTAVTAVCCQPRWCGWRSSCASSVMGLAPSRRSVQLGGVHSVVVRAAAACSAAWMAGGAPSAPWSCGRICAVRLGSCCCRIGKESAQEAQ